MILIPYTQITHQQDQANLLKSTQFCYRVSSTENTVHDRMNLLAHTNSISPQPNTADVSAAA